MASENKNASFSKNFIAGGFAGTIGATILCPLEVVKTRLQSSLYKQNLQQNVIETKNPFKLVGFHVRGVVESLISIKRDEGIRALWKGLGPNLIGIVPARSIYFSCYSKGKEIYTKMNGNIENSLVHTASAITAGSCTALVTNPIWLVKTRMQLQSEVAIKNSKLAIYRNSLHCVRTVIKEEGIFGLYNGISASLLGLSESTLQFVMYEHFKARIMEGKRKVGNEAPTMTWLETIAIASTAKLVAAIATYPHEVIRTRLRQTPENGVRKYTGLWQSAKLIYQQEGMVSLYGGMTAHLMRVVPNAAILFLSYEVIISLIKDL